MLGLLLQPELACSRCIPICATGFHLLIVCSRNTGTRFVSLEAKKQTVQRDPIHGSHLPPHTKGPVPFSGLDHSQVLPTDADGPRGLPLGQVPPLAGLGECLISRLHDFTFRDTLCCWLTFSS